MSQLLPLLLCAVVGCSLQGAAGQSTNVEGQVGAVKDALKDDVAFLVNSVRTMVKEQQERVIQEDISSSTVKDISDINATLHNLKKVIDQHVLEDTRPCPPPPPPPHWRHHHRRPPPPPYGYPPPPPSYGYPSPPQPYGYPPAPPPDGRRHHHHPPPPPPPYGRRHHPPPPDGRRHPPPPPPPY
ncbi:formin-A-like [Haliotis cracherodii]|uniref:formin-A-like n=1 Tax=Haliotis cracherodii TaxID=6455 RepID=UPI0039ED56C2